MPRKSLKFIARTPRTDSLFWREILGADDLVPMSGFQNLAVRQFFVVGMRDYRFNGWQKLYYGYAKLSFFLALRFSSLYYPDSSCFPRKVPLPEQHGPCDPAAADRRPLPLQGGRPFPQGSQCHWGNGLPPWRGSGDRFLKAANAIEHWPTGRGIFYNDDKSFLVWCGEEDHLRIISMQKVRRN